MILVQEFGSCRTQTFYFLKWAWAKLNNTVHSVYTYTAVFTLLFKYLFILGFINNLFVSEYPPDKQLQYLEKPGAAEQG